MDENNFHDTPPQHGQVVEVGLAKAGDRIFAALINQLITFSIVIVLLGVLIVTGIKSEAENMDMMQMLSGSTVFWTGLAALTLYCIIQIYYMSRDGQSIGKKIMRIRVLQTDGNNPGFVGTVLVREIAWSLLLTIAASIIGLALGENGENAVNLLAFLINLVLLFVVKYDRQTLYDMLADTVVVKLPKSK